MNIKDKKRINKKGNSKFLDINKKGENRFLDINKKGLAIETIVILIILLIGTGILLFFYYQINWTGDIDREVCHQSVVYRATLPNFAGVNEYVPLKCKTEKVCITTGNGECSELKGETGILNLKVSNEEEIEQFIAKNILSCWRTMGEGKLSLFDNWFVKNYGIGEVVSSCVVCSRIVFDYESLENAGINMENVDVLDYMIRHKVPGKEVSYYVYLTGDSGKMKIDYGKRTSENIENEFSENTEENAEIVEYSEDLSIVFMQIYSPSYGDSFSNTMNSLGLGLGGSFVLAPVVAGKLAGKAIFSHPLLTAAAFIGGVAIQQGSVYHNQQVTAGYCGDIQVGDDSKKGCSVVRAVNYNLEDLGKFCSKIESIP